MKKHKKLIISPFLTEISKSEAKLLFQNSSEWNFFASKITGSAEVKKSLEQKQRHICPVCGQKLHTDTKNNSIHHISYNHSCMILQEPFSKVLHKERCNFCKNSFTNYFDKCLSRLILVHNRCHKNLHPSR